MATPVQVNTHSIGPGESCYFIAATGSAHNGSLEQAKALMTAARDSGANGIMFQAYDGTIYHDEAPAVRQLVQEERIPDQPGAFAEYMRSRVMGPDWHPALSDHAKELGIDYLPSVFGDSDLTLLADYHRQGKVVLGGLGIESMDHQDPMFVAKVARVAAELGIPVLMSIGVREGDSAATAAAVARDAGANVVLLHSVFGSPSAPEEQGLSELRRLQEELGVPVGFSDHTVGHPDADTPATAHDAIYEGAAVIKAQIRLPEAAGQAPRGPHRALTPDEYHALVTAARDAEKNPAHLARRARPVTRIYEGNPHHPRPSEKQFRALQRTVIATSDIPAGAELTLANCTTRRGGVGVPAREFVPGTTARTAIPAGNVVRAEHLEGAEGRPPQARKPPVPSQIAGRTSPHHGDSDTRPPASGSNVRQ
ncbi:MAG: N-acetylneuraminate synthase family protein [Mycobacteriales bacterium]